MSDAIGSKNTCKTFRLSFSTGSASRNSQSKKVESKKPFIDCIRKPDLGLSRKRPFSTDKSDCIRNGQASGMLAYRVREHIDTSKTTKI